MNVSRRNLLVGSISSASIAALALGNDHATASAANGSTQLAVLDSAVVTFYDSTFANERTVDAPRVIEVSDESDEPAKHSVEIKWDRRVFSILDLVILSQGDQIWSAPVKLIGSRTSLHGRASFEINREVGSASHGKSVVVAIPTTLNRLYPNDSFDSEVPFVFKLKKVGSSIWNVNEWTSVQTAASIRPWGAQLAASWGETEVKQSKDTLKYRFPTALSCASVGPRSIPKGSSFFIDVDSRIIRSVAAKDATLDGVPIDASDVRIKDRIEGDLLRVRITFNQEIPAGSVWVTPLDFTPEPDPKAVTSMRYAVANFTGADSSKGRQRQTGQTSITDLTPSASPRVEDVAEGSI